MTKKKDNLMEFDDKQREAIDRAGPEKFLMITGGAGTGKTTIIKTIAQNLPNPILLAPTGKASARLREATGFEARTIHSLLLFDGHGFNAGNLRGQDIIVDESSMLDSQLLAAITSRSPRMLILVGDQSQLHPVGPGAPFHDMIQLFPHKVVELQWCYRAQEAVMQAGQSIRQGQFPGYTIESEGESWTFLKANNPSQATEKILSFGKTLDFSKDIIVVARNGKKNQATGQYQEATVNQLNPMLLEQHQPNHASDKFDIGDRIICQKNFPDEDIWNGTTGEVSAIDDENQLWVKTDIPTRGEDGDLHEETLFNKDMKQSSRHAYALTIHKSQGSQYRHVIILALDRDHIMLSRPLIYTAVTRAKQSCTVIGQRQALEKALANVPERDTVMKQLALQDQ